MPTTKRQKAKERITLKKFFEVIFKSKFKEDYITNPKNTCYKFIDNLKGTCCKSKHPKKLLEECFERVDEYTDRCSDGLPDFYLRSKVDRVPDLAIEITTLERDHDRFADYKEPFEVKDHNLTVRNLEFVIKLKFPFFVLPPPIKVKRLWSELENELENLKKDLEYIIDRVSVIEKKLEREDQNMYVKDLKKENRERLKEIICDFYWKYRDFVIYTDFSSSLIFPCLGVHIDECGFDVGYVKKIIEDNKEKWLKQYVEKFLEDYFSIRLCINSQEEKRVNVKNSELFTFVVSFDAYWVSEDIDFHVGKIEEFIEESKKKFEKLREAKSGKLDKNPHLELLLVKVTSFAIETFEEHVKELYEKLTQRGYDYPFYPVKDLDNPLNLSEFFIVPNNFSVLSKFYLFCMNGEMKPIDKEIK
jgi:hypothetical protein